MTLIEKWAYEYDRQLGQTVDESIFSEDDTLQDSEDVKQNADGSKDNGGENRIKTASKTIVSILKKDEDMMISSADKTVNSMSDKSIQQMDSVANEIIKRFDLSDKPTRSQQNQIVKIIKEKIKSGQIGDEIVNVKNETLARNGMPLQDLQTMDRQKNVMKGQQNGTVNEDLIGFLSIIWGALSALFSFAWGMLSIMWSMSPACTCLIVGYVLYKARKKKSHRLF